MAPSKARSESGRPPGAQAGLLTRTLWQTEVAPARLLARRNFFGGNFAAPASLVALWGGLDCAPAVRRRFRGRLAVPPATSGEESGQPAEDDRIGSGRNRPVRGGG